MKHRKSIALAAILSTCALQIPLFAGNAASNTSSALAPFTPSPPPTCTPSLALVPWMPPQSDTFQHDYEPSKAILFWLTKPPHDFSSYLAYVEYKKALNDVLKEYLQFVAQKYHRKLITKKRVKQAVKGADQRTVLKGTALKNGSTINPDFVEFYESVFTKNGSIIAEFTKYANATCMTTEAPQVLTRRR